jgi:PIN domain nuclease of toxin-antitoxin system
MRLLIDTHFLFWITVTPEKLKKLERLVLGSEDNMIYCSAASFWELRLKWSTFYASGQRKFATDLRSVVETAEEYGIIPISVTPEHGAAELLVPFKHKDPFDMLLLLQAQEEGLHLLTRDKELLQHPLAFRFDQ